VGKGSRETMMTEARWKRLFSLLWPAAAAIYLLALVLALPGYLDWFGQGWPDPGLPAMDIVADLLSRSFSLFSVLLSLGLAVLLYWRGRGEPMALYFSYFLLTYGLALGGPAELLFYIYTGSPEPAYALSAVLFGAPMTALLVLFPSGRPKPRWARWLIPIAVALLLAYLFYELLDIMLSNGRWVNDAIWAVIVLPSLFALVGQVQRYRFLSTAVERQQMKWALYGILLYFGLAALSSIPWTIARTMPPGTPAPPWQALTGAVWWLLMNVIPAFFTLAILRTNLWNVDVVIRRTLTYSMITTLLVGVYFALVVLTQTGFVAVTGQRNQFALVISTLAIAALFNPLRKRVQTFVDRRFYRRKYDASVTLDTFSEKMRDKVEFEALTTELTEVVSQILQPQHIALWVTDTAPRRPQ